MLDEHSTKALQDMEARLERIEKSVNATKNYLLWTLIITVVVVVLPAILLVFAIPALISTYSAIGNLGL